MTSISVYLDRLSRLVGLVGPLHNFLNAHMASFFTEKMWNALLPDLIRTADTADLERRDLGTLYGNLLAYCRLLYGINNDGQPVGHPANDFETLAQKIIYEISLLKAVCPFAQPPVNTASLPPGSKKKTNALFMMSEKKYIEVEQMGNLVAQYARQTGLEYVVDVGSGKGYLSAMLNMHYGLSVLGLELSAGNVKAADVRASRLRKQWSALCRWVGLDTPPPAGKHLLFSSCTISKSLDLDEIVSSRGIEGESESESAYLLCGLHTCGALGNDLVDIFRRNDSAKALVFVGCCYHLMDEADEESSSDRSTLSCSFPMSSYLIGKRFTLGRGARMLASQSPERILRDGIEDSVRSMFFRALLQILLERHNVQLGSMDCVGRIPVKSIDFVQYFARVKQSVPVPSEVLDEDAELVFQEFKHFEAQVAIVVLFRILLGPCVEQIVVLDRALFLWEQENIANVDVTALFSPEISPRTWAICARKVN